MAMRQFEMHPVHLTASVFNSNGRPVIARYEAIQGAPGLDCFVPRKDDGNPLNLRQFELKIDVVKCTLQPFSLSG
jgi:hypothetical protein